MPRIKLTQRFVNQCQCPSPKKKVDFFDLEVPGLCLEVRISGGKSFYIKYRDTNGFQKQLTLANAKILGLTEARKRARTMLANSYLGNRICEKEISLPELQTFEKFVSNYYIPHIKKYKRAVISELSYIKCHLFPYFGKLPINFIWA